MCSNKFWVCVTLKLYSEKWVQCILLYITFPIFKAIRILCWKNSSSLETIQKLNQFLASSRSAARPGYKSSTGTNDSRKKQCLANTASEVEHPTEAPSIWILFLSHATIWCKKKPFWFCLWNRCSHVKNVIPYLLASYRIQFLGFCTILMALNRFDIVCWVTPNVSTSSYWVCHESWPNNVSNLVSWNFTGLPSRFLSHNNRCLSAALFFKFKQIKQHTCHKGWHG